MAPSSLLEVLIQQLGVICCMQCGEDLMGKQHRMFHLAGCRSMCIVVASREREPLVRAQMKHTRKKQQHCKQDSYCGLDSRKQWGGISPKIASPPVAAVLSSFPSCFEHHL